MVTSNKVPAWVRFTSRYGEERWFDAHRVLTFTQRTYHTDVLLMTDDPGINFCVHVKEEADEVVDRLIMAVQGRNEIEEFNKEEDT